MLLRSHAGFAFLEKRLHDIQKQATFVLVWVNNVKLIFWDPFVWVQPVLLCAEPLPVEVLFLWGGGLRRMNGQSSWRWRPVRFQRSETWILKLRTLRGFQWVAVVGFTGYSAEVSHFFDSFFNESESLPNLQTWCSADFSMIHFEMHWWFLLISWSASNMNIAHKYVTCFWKIPEHPETCVKMWKGPASQTASQGHLWDRALAALKRMCDGYLMVVTSQLFVAISKTCFSMIFPIPKHVHPCSKIWDSRLFFWCRI